MGIFPASASRYLTCLVLACVVCISRAQAQIQILNNGNFQGDSACGSTKVCFSDCQASTGCTYEAACSKVATKAECTVTVKSDITGDAWVAIGFSTDTFMGQDSVTGCKRINNVYSVFNAYNTGRSRPKSLADDGSTLVDGSTQGDVFRCSFSRELAAGLGGERFDLNQNYHWMVARGQLGAGGELNYHTGVGRFVSSQQLELSAPSALTILNNGNFQGDSACGSIKMCFSDCQASTGCTYEAACSKVATKSECTVTVKSDITGDAWVALGFSTDTSMGQDSVTGCKRINNVYSVFNAYNTGKSRPKSLADDGSALVDGSTQGDVFRCSFSRELAAGLGGERFDLNQNYHWMVARGQLGAGGELNYHTGVGRFVSSQQLELSAPSALTILNNGNFQGDSACGSAKVCFSDCQASTGCTYEAACSKVATKAECTVTVKSDITGDAWVAIGFSTDTTMGQDSVTGCKRINNVYSVFNAYNTGRSRPKSLADDGSALVDGSTQGDVFRCSFSRELAAGLGGERFDLNQNYHWMVARGQLGAGGELNYHTGVGRFVSSQQLKLSAPSALTILNNGNFQGDSACGSAKVCFSDCQASTGCTYEAACSKVATKAECTVTVKSDITGDAWVAIGFSTDTTMGQDSVTGCKRINNVYSVFNAYNTGRSRPKSLADDGSALVDGSTQGDVFRCSFSRELAAGLGGERFDLNQNYHWMVARGQLGAGGELNYHTGVGRFVSSQQLKLSAPSALTILNNGNFQGDSACGSAKVCFSDCQASTGCTYEAACSKVATKAECTVTVKSDITGDAWVAIGFSTDTTMGQDSVTGCKRINNVYSVFNAYNTGRSRPKSLADDGSALVDGSTQGDVFRCSFTRELAAGLGGERFDLNQNYHWMVARGQLDGTGALNYHSYGGKFVSSEQLDLSDPGSGSQIPTQPHATPTTANSGDFQVDSACGSTKVCFSDCQASTGCDYEAACSKVATKAECTVTVKSDITGDAWVAIGFSTDTSMGQDSVTGCKRINNAYSVFNAYNNGQSRPKSLAVDGSTLVDGSTQGDVFKCSFTRELAAGLGGERFDLNQNYHWMVARGQLDGAGELRYHGPTGRFVSSQDIDLSDPGTQVTQAPRQTTTPSVSGSLQKSSECGVTKGCFSECDAAGQCTFTVEWSLDAGAATATYRLSSDVSVNSYIALGFSEDDKMGGDDVIGCIGLSDGSARKFSAENSRKSNQIYTDNNLELVNGLYRDGTLTCNLRRPVQSYTVAGRTLKNIDEPLILLFARGSGSIQNNQASLSYHGANNRFFTAAPVAASDTGDSVAKDEEFPLIKLHGALMIGAWVFLASIGVVAARYYKSVWKHDLCSLKVWFQIHRTCMILAFCCCVAGFIVIFIEVEDWVEIEQSPKYLEGHPIMGVIVTGLCVINPLMALFRPHPGTTYRPIFNWAHWFVGTSAHVLGVVTIFFGFELDKADAPDYLRYILAGYAAWHVLVELTLEFMSCCCKKRPARSEVYKMADDGVQRETGPEEETDGMDSVRKGIFVLHFFVVTAISAVLIGLLVVGKKELED